MGYPDKRPPQGLTLAPESRRDRAGRLRETAGRTPLPCAEDARFSTGARVTADGFVRASSASSTPRCTPPSRRDFADIVGAGSALRQGDDASRRGRQGRVLTVRLTKRVPDLLDRTSGLCAVPPSLPAEPEGAKAPLPSAAPYYVAEYVPGERLVLERNRFYRGERPHHVDRFVADLAADQDSDHRPGRERRVRHCLPLGALFGRSCRAGRTLRRQQVAVLRRPQAAFACSS